ncbi:peptidase M14 [Thelephora terrestris]|uniref:Peptidase M14 n=1 Tax=Thelephora terrestris TaxID=56493 RepID=A0A9P6HK41_9AGAM|nr:peptidase M14 [Thelephora terrestris]
MRASTAGDISSIFSMTAGMRRNSHVLEAFFGFKDSANRSVKRRNLLLLVAMFGSTFRSLLLAGLCLSDSQNLAEDQVVVEPKGSPVLRRFNFSSPTQLQKTLDKAQNRGLDVWQATPQHIDIYFPSNSTAPPFQLPFQDFPVLDFGPAQTANPPNSQSWDMSFSTSTFHSSYHPLPEIERFISDLAKEHPNLVELISIGRTTEQREMTVVKISADEKSAPGQKNEEPLKSKGAVVIIGAQHAREWIAVSTALYVAHGLVASPSEHYSLNGLLHHYDFYILPVANPDGYHYTWTEDRFWYKTRQKLSSRGKCIGIDMNRNWGYKWREADKGNEKLCDNWYAGSRPFQTPETNNLANFVWSLSHLKIFLDLRSYGQMISSPYSFSCKRVPKDAEDQLEAASGAASALTSVHAVPYTVGRLCLQLYKAHGNVIDWMYQSRGIKYSYAVHLRDTGTYGFSLPAEWIRPVGEETTRMIKYLANFLNKRPT